MKKLLLLICLLPAIHVFANDSVSVEEMKIEAMQKDITAQNEKLEDKKKDIEAFLQQQEDSINGKLAIYTTFFVIAFGLAGWLLNWLGKREVRNIAGEITNKKIDKELKTKLSKEIIEKKIEEFARPLLDIAIEDFRQKAKEAHVIITQQTEFVKKDRENYELEREKMFSVKEDQPLTKEQKEATDVVQQKSVEDIKAGDSTKAVIDFLYAKALKAYDRDDYDIVINYLTDVLELGDINPDIFFRRGLCFYKKQDYTNAKKDFEKTIDLNPNYEKAHNNLAILLEDQLQNFDSAKLHYEKAIKIDPNYAGVHYNLSILLAAQFQDYNGAKSHYEKAIEINPKFASAYTNLAYLLADHLDNPEKAKELYLKAVEIEPSQKTSKRDKDFRVK